MDTALATTRSYLLPVLKKFSARSFITFISVNFNLLITYLWNSLFLLLLSNKVNFKLGYTIFITIPGKPPPDPTSRTDKSLVKSIILVRVSES